MMEASPSVVGSAFRVFFGVLLLQYCLVGIQRRHVWSDRESLTLRGNTLSTYRI